MIYNVVAVNREEAGMLLTAGFHHGNLAEAAKVIDEIKEIADPFYAEKYKIFKLEKDG